MAKAETPFTGSVQASIEAGDANAFLLHAADAGLSPQEISQGIGKIASVLQVRFEKAARQIKSYDIVGPQGLNGQPVRLRADNTFEVNRARKLGEMAAKFQG